ncbi:MAG: hypothetical protein AAGA91_15700 [Pseudomonadota bacterium]
MTHFLMALALAGTLTLSAALMPTLESPVQSPVASEIESATVRVDSEAA